MKSGCPICGSLNLSIVSGTNVSGNTSSRCNNCKHKWRMFYVNNRHQKRKQQKRPPICPTCGSYKTVWDGGAEYPLYLCYECIKNNRLHKSVAKRYYKNKKFGAEYYDP